ncbi:MAG: hypothetical protein U1F43_01450 [Myxococcota bacterium]
MMVFFVAPHAVGCATTQTTNWELNRRATELAPPAEVRSTCGGDNACVALCDAIIDRQMEDPKLKDLCQSDHGDEYGIESCRPSGQDLLITCYLSDSSKGSCSMPDS